jgi:hypothetical protein
VAINGSGAVAVPLDVYGSWVTQVPPESVPENISPDNQEIIYAPGKVASRPAFQKLLNSAFPAGGLNDLVPTVMYEKSYAMPNGVVQNLYLDSSGILWAENVFTAPGTFTQIYQTQPGSFAKSITAFGREYIAISNGLVGADVPLQWDGTNLDRLTQDGPGVPPTVTMQAFAAVNMVGGTAPSPVNVTTSETINPIRVGPPGDQTTVWTALLVLVSSTVGFSIGQSVALADSSNPALNATVVIYGIQGTGLYCNFYSPTQEVGAGGTATPVGSNITMTRANNQVTVTTSTAHNLQVGFQALIAGAGSLAVGGGVTSIVIDNEDNPGIATVTTLDAHGLVPGTDVTITNVTPTAIGSAGSWTAEWNGSLVTLTLGSGVHGLVPGAVVQVTDTNSPADAFPGSFTVATVPAPNQIAYYQTGLAATAPISATGISVSVTWPIPDDTPTPTYFEVLSAPTATTFQIQVSYSDGTWNSGNIGFPWDGTFYVVAVPNSTTAIYQQYGPAGTNTTIGTVTPYGQMAPGLHLCQVSFLDRQGGITAPSPPVAFIANGGQYPVVSNLPIGGSNIVARIVEFTGAQPNVPGELPPFFYIPTPAQLEGQVVSTATQVSDNTTTSILMDFSDDTLYAALGISIPGNTLANQIVLDGALSFGKFESRLLTCGQRNRIEEFLNMQFGGGYFPNTPTVPTGWTQGTGVGQLIASPTGPAGFEWQSSTTGMGAAGTIQQGAYQDAYGDPILSPNTQYSFRAKVRYGSSSGQSNGLLNADFYSPTAGILATASIAIPSYPASADFEFLEAEFSAKTPTVIPQDTILQVYQSGASVNVDISWTEQSIIYAQDPTIPDVGYASYGSNPAGMDGDTGQFGPEEDTHALMDFGIIRDTLYMITLDPSGRLHETLGSNVTEPSGWQVNEVAANCGTLSAFGLTHSQADDTSGSGGDNWLTWPSEGGIMGTAGGLPEKISQEIQPNWNDPSNSNTGVQINMQAAQSIWGLNDPVQRLLMFGVPIGTATAPSEIYVLDYKNLNTWAAIAGSPPFHPSFAGKLIATDNSRKWTHWLRPMNCAARMYRQPGQLTLVFGGGNGYTPGTVAGFGNCYTLNPALYTDDDFGQIFPYYTTYAFLDPEKAQALGLKGGRLLMAYVRAYCQGVGQATATYFPDSLENPWALATTRTLGSAFYADREFGGGMCTGERIFIKFSSSPITGTDNAFVITRVTAYIGNAKLLIGGRNQ